MHKKDPWHSVKQAVHHNNTNCNTGNNIERENYRTGTGGKALCEECADLNTSGRYLADSRIGALLDGCKLHLPVGAGRLPVLDHPNPAKIEYRQACVQRDAERAESFFALAMESYRWVGVGMIVAAPTALKRLHARRLQGNDNGRDLRVKRRIIVSLHGLSVHRAMGCPAIGTNPDVRVSVCVLTNYRKMLGIRCRPARGTSCT